MSRWRQYDPTLDVWYYDNKIMPHLSVADELAFESLPIETQELCKKIHDYYEALKDLSYRQGYNDGKNERLSDEAAYKEGYADALEAHGIKE